MVVKFITILFLFIYSLLPAQCLKMDVMLVGDLSASVIGNEHFIVEAFEALISKTEMSEEGIRIGVITFNTSVYRFSELTGNKSTALRATERIAGTRAGGTTNMSEALRVSLSSMMQDRPDASKLIVLVSDGVPTDPRHSFYNRFSNKKSSGICYLWCAGGGLRNKCRIYATNFYRLR